MTTLQATTTTQQVANRLVELCRKGDFQTAQNELFDTNARSIEAQEWGVGQKK